MQTRNPIFDDIAELMTGAAGAVANAGEEVKTMARSQMDRVVADMDLVSREEFDTLKDMLMQTRAELEAAQKELAAMKMPTGTVKRKPRAKKKPAAKPSGVK